VETASIIVHLLLLATLFFKRAWDYVPFLGLIALLGLGCTPLMHYASAHAPAEAYFYIYVLLDIVMSVLYIWSIFFLYCTPLDWIGYSQVIYLTIKCLAWWFFFKHQDASWHATIDIMRHVNIFLIFFWTVMIWLYDERQRRSIDGKQPNAANTRS
jgi:hypothetical protein